MKSCVLPDNQHLPFERDLQMTANLPYKDKVHVLTEFQYGMCGSKQTKLSFFVCSLPLFLFDSVYQNSSSYIDTTGANNLKQEQITRIVCRRYLTKILLEFKLNVMTDWQQ